MRSLRGLKIHRLVLTRFTLAVLLLISLAARTLLPGAAGFIRQQLLRSNALGSAISAFSEATAKGEPFGEAVSVFCEALDAPH